MRSIFIIHGAFGSPDENWIPWLKKKLEQRGYFVEAPKFPTPKNQNLQSWDETIKPYSGKLDQNAILIGHSIGATFVAHLLQKHRAAAAFFVSGFSELLGNATFDQINRTFVEEEIDWQVLQKNCPQRFAFHGGNDPYVPLAAGKRFAQNVGADLTVIPRGGHLNEAAGFDTFEQLLARVDAVL